MKENKNDSARAIARFGRDKRTRTVTATAERVERRPRAEREPGEQPAASNFGTRRASYNPHFTEDNRPAFEKPRREEGGREYKPFDGERRTFGGKPHYGSKYPRREQKPYGEHNSYADRDSSRFDERRSPEEGRREYKPFDGERRTFGGSERSSFDGERRSFGDKPRYGSKYPRREQKPYGEHNSYADRESSRFDERRSPEEGRREYKPFGGERWTFDGSERSSFGRGGRKPFGNRGPKQFGDKPYRKSAPRRRDEKPAVYPKYNPEKQTDEMRLNRFIAQSGICSRREADDFIAAGVVTVNGKVVTELGTKVQPTDEVRFNDTRIQGEKKVYLVLNKPKGYVTSLDDPHASKTVIDLVKGACEERIYPVGRLDKNSLGLLLFTNDGDLTKQLTHPAYHKKKIYQVTLDKPLTRADMDRIAEGITLEDGEIHADEISYVKENKQEVGIEIHSGRNRIVRRIFEFLGYEVKKLDRVYYAGLTKKNLKRGQWRFLTDEEVQRLKSGQYE